MTTFFNVAIPAAAIAATAMACALVTECHRLDTDPIETPGFRSEVGADDPNLDELKARVEQRAAARWREAKRNSNTVSR